MAKLVRANQEVASGKYATQVKAMIVKHGIPCQSFDEDNGVTLIYCKPQAAKPPFINPESYNPIFPSVLLDQIAFFHRAKKLAFEYTVEFETKKKQFCIVITE